jgi:hypothetical protein
LANSFRPRAARFKKGDQAVEAFSKGIGQGQGNAVDQPFGMTPQFMIVHASSAAFPFSLFLPRNTT